MRSFLVIMIATAALIACNSNEDKTSETKETGHDAHATTATAAEMPPMPEVPANAKVFFCQPEGRTNCDFSAKSRNGG